MRQKLSSILTKKVAVAIAAACMIALLFSSFLTLHRIRQQLQVSCGEVTEDFSGIMEEYTHFFQLYEKTVERDITKNEKPKKIEKYLKQLDSEYSEIEGSDYDGVYMYYQDQYLYSWGTPHAVYEADGYNAKERPWYTGAIAAKGEICFSVPYRSYANAYMLATISRLQPDGKTVLAYDIKLGAIQDYVEQLDVYHNSLTLICDEEGNMIGTTEPLYAGGNYLRTSGQLAKNVVLAEKELGLAQEEDKKKAEQKVESERALQSFCENKKEFLKRISRQPKQIHFEAKSASFGYAYNNGTYLCFVLIPFLKVLPGILMLWAASFLLFTVAILLIENIIGRLHSIKVIEYKNQQLAEAVVRADAASVAKSQFLAQMSHEIRTPMNAIIGLTSIAKTEVAYPDKITDYLNKIDGSSRLLLSIINDVLDMSAIEGGKLKIDKAQFNFRKMLSNITTVFYEQAKQKDIIFEVRMNGITEENIIGDELRVNQILMNLLSNAIKFTPPGGEVDLIVIQSSCSQGKVQLRFSVSDTGCGMSQDMLGRLFLPFEQESASTARKHGGSGLGLSITKKLVEMMGGSIQVKSIVSEGSVFTVDIPFESSTADSKKYQNDIPKFSDIHALVVDDDLDSCEYSGMLLERLGVRYDFATDGETALEMMGEAGDQKDPYTLCLVDWKMPEMDGGELTQQIREIFGEKAVIIIVSAYDLNEVEASGRAKGANYYVPKPLFQSTLFNALMKIFGGDYTKVEADPGNKEYDFAGRRVLIAEDVALNMEVAVKLLGKVNIQCVCAEDGRQAVELFKKAEPGFYDCILMDINMPVMDGYEAAREIRRYYRKDAAVIPIYAMTANAFSEDVTAALNAGMNGHIAKPIETAVLYKTLEAAFADKDQNEKKEEKEEQK